MIKKGSHLKGVEPINELKISNHDFFEILKKKICLKSNQYKYMKQLVGIRDLYDKSGYSGNSVLIVKKDDEQNNEMVIKIGKQGNLHDEYIAYKFFYKLSYTAKPIKYFKCNNYEIMITSKINLPTAGNYFNNYKEISKFFGEKLRQFHDEKLIDSMFSSNEKQVFNSKYEENFYKAINNEKALIYMVNYLEYDNIDEMKKYLIKNKNILYRNRVLVHGDFNPNNIFIDENQDIKIIDFCDSGFCNKHYDIFWTMFMIIIFSGILKNKQKIKKCEKIFLNSYGLDKINYDELKYFKYFCCLYWKQHDEITRINIL